jgi:hypothetical protein
MGIDVNGARFLTYARAMGVDFAQTAMIGRQSLYISHDDMRGVLESFGHSVSDDEIAEICSGGYSEALLRRLGARDTHSFDYSAYQSATHTHDMNVPIPDALKEQYTAVLDGGTLEHVFNFPVAIKNCMEMVKVGGHYLAITPANNFFGHGFYQFSPELYFTVLAEENGFEVVKIIALEERDKPAWYAIKSPREVADRVTLTNTFPVHLLVIARRIASRPIFAQPPQQSDYTAIWTGDGSAGLEDRQQPSKMPLPLRIAKAILPFPVRRAMRRALEPKPRKPAEFDPRFFALMDMRSASPDALKASPRVK